MLSLARLPQVTLLDYSPITVAERTNAELYYLSRISEELKETSHNSKEERKVLASHPQWDALCAKHDYQVTVKRAGDEPPPTYPALSIDNIAEQIQTQAGLPVR